MEKCWYELDNGKGGSQKEPKSEVKKKKGKESGRGGVS